MALEEIRAACARLEADIKIALPREADFENMSHRCCAYRALRVKYPEKRRNGKKDEMCVARKLGNNNVKCRPALASLNLSALSLARNGAASTCPSMMKHAYVAVERSA